MYLFMVVCIQLALQKETSIDRITPERFLKIVRKLSPFKSDEDMLELSTVLIYLSSIYVSIYLSIISMLLLLIISISYPYRLYWRTVQMPSTSTLSSYSMLTWSTTRR